ncbi:MAG: M48 family metalloprotease [Candidatus Aminicenantes bacterium]|nr:M48 family metalloprotease [Candidatus Aminicenantes bacterium]
MIYTNFLYFIIAIMVFLGAPAAPGGMFTMTQDIMCILIVILGFWNFTRNRFLQLRRRLKLGTITLEEAKKEYFSRTNIHIVIGIALFAFEIFVFDLKYLVAQVFIFGFSEFLTNIIGLAFFMLHLVIVWYWGFHAMGDVLDLDRSAQHYIRSNIKFNLVILVPWLILTVIYDVSTLLVPGLEDLINAPLFREVFSGVFLVVVALFAPIFITRLWDCKPLPPSELKDKIIAFAQSQGVKFKEIMSWNALGKGLVTAGVMGVAAPFRYLLITPALMDLLDENEIMAVVSHEVGHVKKKHLPLYLVFLMGLMLLTGAVQDWILDFFLTTHKGLGIVFPGQNVINTGVISAISIPVLLLIFVGYFRFIFGFFMRNFERQADGFCIESGIDANYMISSFMKLGVRLGDDGKKSNWHHFNLSQRIDYIKKAMADPATVSLHNRKVKRWIGVFAVLLILFSVVSYKGQPNLKRWAAIIEHQLESTPDDHRLYSVLGELYYQLQEWQKAKKAYEYAVGLNYQQPETLNNLAWLLLTSGDESLRDPKRALKLAGDSVGMKESAHSLDTLAEAYYQNHLYPEALNASKRALELGTEDGRYLKKQYEKMKEALQKNGFL